MIGAWLSNFNDPTPQRVWVRPTSAGRNDPKLSGNELCSAKANLLASPIRWKRLLSGLDGFLQNVFPPTYLSWMNHQGSGLEGPLSLWKESLPLAWPTPHCFKLQQTASNKVRVFAVLEPNWRLSGQAPVVFNLHPHLWPLPSSHSPSGNVFHCDCGWLPHCLVCVVEFNVTA